MSSHMKAKPAPASMAGGMRRRAVPTGTRGSATAKKDSGAKAGSVTAAGAAAAGQRSLFNSLSFTSGQDPESPGLKIGPTLVLMMSLCFIVFVVLLHIFGKVIS
eukprot:TRINITY_DN2860_c0_g1_i1.p4 TRINITY_DN2860_c0_g1~~TRINITY_DN2860_c0_g1_i1.p4  ORF type:complete len:104 (+),score=20.43 TRINITY_DN2860_c0_g1_i1:121-432(+)